MAAITPPSMNIINMMKDAIKQAKAFIINFDDMVELNSINNFFIFDDANKLLYAIDQNSEVLDQSIAPYRIRSFDYNRLEFFRYII